jgi:hypothetical protein
MQRTMVRREMGEARTVGPVDFTRVTDGKRVRLPPPPVVIIVIIVVAMIIIIIIVVIVVTD